MDFYIIEEDNKNINLKNNIIDNNSIHDGEMYFDDIYNSIIEDIEDLLK